MMWFDVTGYNSPDGFRSKWKQTFPLQPFCRATQKSLTTSPETLHTWTSALDCELLRTQSALSASLRAEQRPVIINYPADLINSGFLSGGSAALHWIKEQAAGQPRR